jgi:hypothetical protein
MLNKVILQLSMDLSVVPNASMNYEEPIYPICIMLWLNRIPIEDVPKVMCHVELIFNDRVSQDDATYSYLP